jgi:ribokinase
MYDVITIGSNTIDVFVYTDKTKSFYIKTLDDEEHYIAYPVGSKLLIDQLDFFTGGGGTNTAVCLSRLQLKTGYLGKVGKDIQSQSILEVLKKEKVDFLGFKDDYKDNKTGYSVILDSLEKKRTVLTHKGINDYLFYDEIDLKKLNAGWFCMTSMMGESFMTLERLSQYARENSIKILFNASNYLCKKGVDFLDKIIKNTTVIVLNDEEANILIGRKKKVNQLRSLKELGPDIAIITDGERPVHCMDGEGNHFVLYPPKVKVVETTGAGDAFAASFLAGLIKDGSIKYALKLASINSRSVLQYRGAKEKLLTYDEAKKKMSRTKIKIEKIPKKVKKWKTENECK